MLSIREEMIWGGIAVVLPLVESQDKKSIPMQI
jgi:hypothetical protein